MKIAFIGSFNPVTIAHLILAQRVIDEVDGDIIFVPVSDLYDKVELYFKEDDRLNMLKLATFDNERMSCSDIEIEYAKRNKRQAKTIETLRLLKEYYQDDIYLLLGNDNFNNLYKWYKSEEIVQDFKIIVYPRAEVELNLDSDFYLKYKDSFIFIDSEVVTNISSTLIRDNIRNNKSNKYLLHDKVIDYLNKMN